MAVGVIDSTVAIHVLRNSSAARSWFSAQTIQLSATPITWLEVMYGAPSKREQVRSKAFFDQCDMIHLTQSDMEWAMEQLVTFRLSHGITIMDCLIASVCHRLQIPLYTHNVRDMTILLGSSLVIQPY